MNSDDGTDKENKNGNQKEHRYGRGNRMLTEIL